MAAAACRQRNDRSWVVHKPGFLRCSRWLDGTHPWTLAPGFKLVWLHDKRPPLQPHYEAFTGWSATRKLCGSRDESYSLFLCSCEEDGEPHLDVAAEKRMGRSSTISWYTMA